MQFPPVQDVWFLTGPTASGKSAVGVEVAKQINAEIISMDSMAVYREMNIGTAKPSVEERAAVEHHLIDLVTPDEEFSISQYLHGAHAAIESIRKKNRNILFVGGTPLYLKALLTGFDDGPQADWNLRAQLEAEAASRGGEALYEELKKKDPQAAARIHPNDQRRVIRALEYFEKTGRSIIASQKHFDLQADRNSVRGVALDWTREILHRRINIRVEEMFRTGWVDEVRHLLEKYQMLGRTAMQAVGYRQIGSLLRGEIDLESAIQRTQAGTRQLARRQLIWLRSLRECQRISLSPPMDMDQVTRQIIQIEGSEDISRAED